MMGETTVAMLQLTWVWAEHRHPVVDLGDKLVRLDNDHGAGLERLAGKGGPELLNPAAENVLQRWPVSKRVNSSRASQDPTLIDKVPILGWQALLYVPSLGFPNLHRGDRAERRTGCICGRDAGLKENPWRVHSIGAVGALLVSPRPR